MKKVNRHKIITEKYGEHFCASPWNSFHEGPKGLVSTCCKSRTPIGWSNKQSFEDMYNSDHAKDTRAKFLRGEKPQQCNACWQQEVKGDAAFNRVFGNNNSNLDNLDTLIAATDADGTLHEHKPNWLDFLWTNKCNFACLGCTPELSTTINDKYKKEFAVLNKGGGGYFDHMDSWKNSGANKVQYVLDHVDTIDNIHLNGGEPWLSEETYELLEELLKRGLNKKIFISLYSLKADSQLFQNCRLSITNNFKEFEKIWASVQSWNLSLSTVSRRLSSTCLPFLHKTSRKQLTQHRCSVPAFYFCILIIFLVILLAILFKIIMIL